MSYWKCTNAEILEGGEVLRLAFEDCHSIETACITLPSDVWKDISVFRAAYDEPERKLTDLHRRVAEVMWTVCRSKRAAEGEE